MLKHSSSRTQAWISLAIMTPTATSEGRVTAWKRERRFAKLTRLVVLKTGRGKLFHVELTYPADANELLD